jgi:inactivated superfamily I helicase
MKRKKRLALGRRPDLDGRPGEGAAAELVALLEATGVAQLIAGLDRPPKLGPFDEAHQSLDVEVPPFHGLFEQQARQLREALDEERAWHDWLERKMVVEEILAEARVLRAVASRPDARMTMRSNSRWRMS